MRRIEAWWALESTALALCCGLVAARGDEEGEGGLDGIRGEEEWRFLLLPGEHKLLLCCH